MLTFLAACTFHTARSGDPQLGAIEVLRTMFRDGRSILLKRVLTSFALAQGRAAGGGSDRPARL